MTTRRQDLSKWALHFIHDYNADNEPSDEIIRFDLYGGHPYHEDKELNDRFDCTSSNQSGPMSSFRKSDFLPVIRPRRCV